MTSQTSTATVHLLTPAYPANGMIVLEIVVDVEAVVDVLEAVGDVAVVAAVLAVVDAPVAVDTNFISIP